MNRLIFPNGGFPLHGDDFGFIQDAAVDALKASLWHVASRHSGNVIISGCVVSYDGFTCSISAGYALINYEIVFVPAHSFATPSLSGASIKLAITYDPAGNDVFADAVARNTYQVRRGLGSVNVSGANEIILDDPARVYGVLNVSDFQNDWVAFAGQTPVCGFDGRNGFIRGVFAGGLYNTVAFSLPSDHLIPSTRLLLSAGSGAISIETDGTVVLYGPGGGGAVTSFHAHVVFPLD